MNIWDLFWFSGETLSLAVLACGAVLSLLETEPFATLVLHLKQLGSPWFHEPLNHRLVDFDHHMVEW